MSTPLSRLAIPRVPAKEISAGLVPLHDHPLMRALAAEEAALSGRLHDAEQRSARAKALGAAPRIERPVAERARDLVAGGTIPSAEPRAEAAAAEEEIHILRQAIFELSERRADTVSLLTFEASKRYVSRNTAALRAMDAAMGALHDANAELHAIYAELAAAGYQGRTDVLPAPIPRPVYQLGDPAGSSAAGAFRTWLRKTFGEK
jgi:hypothetical protein